MWIFVNAHNTSTASYSNETIFSYGTKTDDESCFKPKITYSLSDNKYLRHKLYGRDEREQSLRIQHYRHKQPKWNNIVINYNDNDIDLFINGCSRKRLE
jgi:hypothetical protein